MAVLFMDGFDAGDFAMKWEANYAAASSLSTRFGSGKSITTTANTGYIKKPISASGSLYVGLAVYADATALGVHATDPPLLALFGDSGATLHLSLRPASAGTLGLFRGATLLGSFSFSVKVWRYIELYATIHDTAGAYTLKIDGIEMLSATNVDTKNGGTNDTIDQVQLGKAVTSNFIIDDFYVSDSGFMGDIRIQTLVPTAAGTSTQLTPTGGANYANVADIPDSLATYNASSTIGNKDLYALGDLAATTTTVKCVQVNTHSWKDDAGTASLKAKIKSGTTEADGATTSLPSSVAWVGDRWETDPDTAAAWTVSAVNSLEAGAEVA